MNTMSSEDMRWLDEPVLFSEAGPAWDHLIKQPGLVLVEMGHTQEQACAASWVNSQEKELPYN